MPPTLASYLDFLTPWISPELISAPYLSRIRKISEQLPVLSWGSFECWLAANEPRVDFNICINPRINEHITMRDWQPEKVSFESDAYLEMRKRIRFFCNTWSQKDFFLKQLLGELWEVYDITDQEEPSTIVPWLYISFLHNFLYEDQTIKAAVIAKALPLIDNELSPDLIIEFSNALNIIPASVRIATIGIQKRYEAASLRLFLEIDTFEELIKVLRQQRWPGNLDELKEKMAPWINSRRLYGLALDFNGTFQSKIGIECHFQSDRLQEDLDLFTQNLHRYGLCSASKRKALLDWNGTFEVETAPDFWSWPDRVLTKPERIPQKVKIRKMAFYIKLVFEPNKPLIAKAYPMFYRAVMRESIRQFD